MTRLSDLIVREVSLCGEFEQVGWATYPHDRHVHTIFGRSFTFYY